MTTGQAEQWRAIVRENLCLLGKANLERHFVGFAIEPGDRICFLVRDLGAELILKQEVTLGTLLERAFRVRNVAFKAVPRLREEAPPAIDLAAARLLAKQMRGKPRG